MRRWAQRAALVVAGSAVGCRLFGGAPEPTEAPSPIDAPSALEGQVGTVLELNVPLLGGGTMALADQRGTPVLLDLSDAPSGPREPAQARYRALVDERGDAVTVVSVALDPEVGALPAAWTDDPPPFVLGWDPQGALAARLRLRVLPTVVLLDAQGTIVSVHEGAPPDDAALRHWLSSSAAATPAR